MFVFKAKNLRKEWDGKTLFENIDLELKQGEHVALFGRNGAGKTTLLNGLLGKTPFDNGFVERFEPLENWGMLEQDPAVQKYVSTAAFVQQGSRLRYSLKKELEKLQNRMAKESVDTDVLDQYNRVYNQFLQEDGYNLETEAETALYQVNLHPSSWETPYHQLSGGQKTRAQLARLILQKPSCIIMDEPTNHLDKETTAWLERWLQRFSGAVVYVSHDREFLDRTADAIYELKPDACNRYPGGYSDYRRQKEVEQRTQESLYRKQEKKRQELQQAIDRYQKWFHLAHKAAGQDDFARAKAKKNVSRFRAKEAELERLESNRVEKPEAAGKVKVQLEESVSVFAARRLFHMENLSFSYDKENSLISHLTTSVNRGDRMGLIGPNGSGKSTLLQLIIGKKKPDEGSIKINPQTTFGYFAQELDNLDEHKTILESMLDLPGMTQSEARTILGCFLFSKGDVFKKIQNLSMGEKCRLAFVHLYFSNANLLILDEPTNFLDVESKEVIEDALQSYPGALIVVSHDRYLIRKTANRIMELDGRNAVDYHGGYEDFLEHKEYAMKNSPENNPIRKLELKLAQLMHTETEDEEEQQQILKEIKNIKQMLDEED